MVTLRKALLIHKRGAYGPETVHSPSEGQTNCLSQDGRYLLSGEGRIQLDRAYSPEELNLLWEEFFPR